jgi:hypothetical protein
VSIPLTSSLIWSYEVILYQFTHYFNHYKDDKWTLKLAVVGLVIMSVLKTAQCMYVVICRGLLLQS